MTSCHSNYAMMLLIKVLTLMSLSLRVSMALAFSAFSLCLRDSISWFLACDAYAKLTLMPLSSCFTSSTCFRSSSWFARRFACRKQAQPSSSTDSSDKILHGHPPGGVAILWNTKIEHLVKEVRCNVDWGIGINVYTP